MTPFVESINGASGAILAALGNTAAACIAVVLFAWIYLRFVGGVGARARHLIWWAVLAIVVALPASRVVSLPEPPVTVATAPNAVVSVPLSPAPVAASEAIPEEPSSTVEVKAGYLPLFAAIFWAVAFLVQLVRIAYSYAHLRRIRQSATPAPKQLRLEFDEWVLSSHVERNVRLLVSDAVKSPIAAGFRHPAVIIPRTMLEQLPSEDIEHVLLHELAHLARRDDWTNLIARVLSGVLAFHPLAHWLLRRIDHEREIACDDWVVAATGTARSYAVTLARLFEFRISEQREMLATGIGGRNSRFSDRIARLLSSGNRGTSLKRVAACTGILVLLAAAGALAPDWLALAQDEPPAPPAPPALEAEAPPPPPPAPASRAARPARPIGAVHAAMAAPPPPPPPPAHPPEPHSGESFLNGLSDAGYGNLSVDKVIELKVHGVTGSWIKGIAQAGWGKLTPKELVELRVHGVQPEYVRQIHALGFGPYNPKQIVQFQVHGVEPELFKALKDAGYGSVDAAAIVNARVHGVSPSNLQEAKKLGNNLTLEQIVRLKVAGVI